VLKEFCVVVVSQKTFVDGRACRSGECRCDQGISRWVAMRWATDTGVGTVGGATSSPCGCWCHSRCRRPRIPRDRRTAGFPMTSAFAPMDP
jgi:hypothetical protein